MKKTDTNRIKENLRVKEENILAKWVRPDIYVILAVMLISAVGLVFVFDTCYTSGTNNFKDGFLQIVWIVLGAVLCFLCSRCDLRIYKNWTPLVMIVSLLLLVYMKFRGVSANGAVRWIRLGPITVQPSEFAKIAIVLGMALVTDLTRLFAYRIYKKGRVNRKWFWAVVVMLAFILFFVAKSSMSAIILSVMVICAMLFYGNIHRSFLGKIFIFIVVIGMVLAFPAGRWYVNRTFSKENLQGSELSYQQEKDAKMLESALSKEPEMRTDEEKALADNFYHLNFSVKSALARPASARNDYEKLLVSNYKKYTADYSRAKKKSRENRNEYEKYLVSHYRNLYFDEDLTEDKIHLRDIYRKKEEHSKSLLRSFAKDKSGKTPWRGRRMNACLNPKKYDTEEGYQVANSLTAISMGGFFGKGLGKGECKFNLPESHNDFIFASIVEELGCVGGIFIFFLYIFLTVRSFRIMDSCRSLYGKVLCCGSVSMILLGFFINIMVSLNIIPSTGVCLP